MSAEQIATITLFPEDRIDWSDPEIFAELVALEARDEGPPGAAERLRSPENLDRWVTALGDIVRSLCHQSAAINEAEAIDVALVDEGQLDARELSAKRAERASRRRRMARFRRGVETRLSEAKSLVKEQNIQRMQWMRYRDAIEVHRTAMLAVGLEPEDHDLTLWSTLEGTEDD